MFNKESESKESIEEIKQQNKPAELKESNEWVRKLNQKEQSGEKH